MAVNVAYRRQLAIDALLRTTTIEDAARLSGISNRTIHRYLGEPSFLDKLQQTKRHLFEHALNELLVNAHGMARTIHTLAADATVPPSARISAATRGLGMLKDTVLLENLERKVMELETARNADGRSESDAAQGIT